MTRLPMDELRRTAADLATIVVIAGRLPASISVCAGAAMAASTAVLAGLSEGELVALVQDAYRSAQKERGT